MALVYAADLRPSKMELLAEWLPRQDWFDDDASALVRFGAFRFDDPAGEVGLETILVGAGNNVYQVPLSYRGAPLVGAEEFLAGTMQHSVLGDRWVYDATADPVYLTELAAALLAGKPQAVQFREAAGGLTEILPETAQLASTGAAASVSVFGPCQPTTADAVTTVSAGALTLRIVRKLDTSGAVQGEPVLTVTWLGQETAVHLAGVA